MTASNVFSYSDVAGCPTIKTAVVEKAQDWRGGTSSARSMLSHRTAVRAAQGSTRVSIRKDFAGIKIAEDSRFTKLYSRNLATTET